MMRPLDVTATADTDELTRELIDQMQRVEEELRGVYDVIDQLRESIEQITRGYRQDDWRPVQPAPIVSFPVDPCEPEFGRKINAVDPDTLPDDVPMHVRQALTARLRSSGRRDIRTGPDSQDENGVAQVSSADETSLDVVTPLSTSAAENGPGFTVERTH